MPTNAEKIDGLIKVSAILEENVVTLQRNLDQFKASSDKLESQVSELVRQLTRVEEGLRHTRQKLDELDADKRIVRIEEALKHVKEKADQRDARRFEILKILIGPLIAVIISVVITAILTSGYRMLPSLFDETSSAPQLPAKK